MRSARERLDAALRDSEFEVEERISLHPEGEGIQLDERFSGRAIFRVKGIPRGYELAAVSQLSAALADSTRNGTGVVELNYRLPLAGAAGDLRLSKQARSWADSISRSFLGVANAQATSR